MAECYLQTDQPYLAMSAAATALALHQDDKLALLKYVLRITAASYNAYPIKP